MTAMVPKTFEAEMIPAPELPMTYPREVLVKEITAATEGEKPLLMTMRDGSVYKLRLPIVIGEQSITFQCPEWHDKKTVDVAFEQIVTVAAI